jgi:hypothetical protein
VTAQQEPERVPGQGRQQLKRQCPH